MKLKLIMENWNSFISEQQSPINILFTGNNVTKDNLKLFLHKNNFKPWEISNGRLIILPYPNENYSIGKNAKVNKIIGFSAGATAAYNLSIKHPNAELVFIDPWMPKNFKEPKKFTYYGTSCYMFNRPDRGTDIKNNKNRLIKIGVKGCAPNSSNFRAHEEYFKKYFSI